MMFINFNVAEIFVDMFQMYKDIVSIKINHFSCRLSIASTLLFCDVTTQVELQQFVTSVSNYMKSGTSTS